MDPSFRQIAELFQIPLSEAPAEVANTPRRMRGRDASDSEDLGRQSLNDGDFQAAIKHFKQAIEQRGTETADVCVDLGGAYDYADLEPQALRQYRKARKMLAGSPEPLLGISDVYKRYGRFRESIEGLEAAIKLDPNNPFFHIKLAETLREMGELKRALVAAQGAVAVKPDEAFYHYWVGDLSVQMGRYEEALDSLRAAIELSPGDDFLYLRAAVAFWRVGRQQESIKAIRLASDLDPEKHVYHGLLEVLLEEMGQKEEADLECGRADKMDRYDHDTLTRTLGEMGIEGDHLVE